MSPRTGPARPGPALSLFRRTATVHEWAAARRGDSGTLPDVDRRPRRLLIVILTLALVARVGWAVAQPRTAAAIDRLPDQREYLSLAENLVRQHTLRLFDPRFQQDVFAYRLPGYPVAIAACGRSVLAVRLIQAAVDTATVLGVFLLARTVCGSAAVAVAAAAWAQPPRRPARR